MKTRLIVALDLDTLNKTKAMLSLLPPSVDLFKVGSQLFTAYGPEAVRAAGKRGKVFLDLKFHDIPNTVRNAAYAAASPDVFMMTVHACGGVEMMKGALQGAEQRAREEGRERPLIVGVTVLTSGAVAADTSALVRERAAAAKAAGIDGVVCAVTETVAIRKEFGPGFVIVNPGIRPAGAERGDQKRVATPAEAAKAGADYIVVGRPILEAPDPQAAVAGIVQELA